MFDVILNNFFTTLGGTSFLLGVSGIVLSFCIIISLIDNVIDL